MVNSTMQNGLTGMQTALQSMTLSATNIAHSNIRTNETGAAIKASVTQFAQPLVELRMDQTLFDASANVVSTSVVMIGALLDVTA